MREVTRVITCEITMIDKREDAVARPSNHDDFKELADIVKKHLGVDDVVVTNAQCFLREQGAT